MNIIKLIVMNNDFNVGRAKKTPGQGTTRYDHSLPHPPYPHRKKSNKPEVFYQR